MTGEKRWCQRKELSPTGPDRMASDTRRCGNRTTHGSASASWPTLRSFWTTPRPMGRRPMEAVPRDPCPRFPRPRWWTAVPSDLAAWSWPQVERQGPTTCPLLPPTRSTRHSHRTTTRHHHLMWSNKGAGSPRRPMGAPHRGRQGGGQGRLNHPRRHLPQGALHRVEPRLRA